MNRAGRRTAVEADAVDTNGAALTLRSLRRLECDRRGTTALSVLNDGALRLAGVVLGTDSLVWHLIVTFNISVLARRDFVFVDGHLIIAIAPDRWLVIEVGSDALRLEGSLG